VARLRSVADVPWMQPYPDVLLDQVAALDEEPDAVVVERETIELAFLAALQVLPPRQRAVLVLRDVLGKPAAEAASILDTSVAAANSALQRARVTMQDHLPARRADWTTSTPTAEERALLDLFIDAHERCDADAALAIAAQDIRITMPPYPFWFSGIDDAIRSLTPNLTPARWRFLPTTVNHQPTLAAYLEHHLFALDIFRVEEGRIAEITAFETTDHQLYDLPERVG